MAGAADCNAGGEIQEPIAINVPDFDTAPMRHHERVLARIRRRYYFGIAGQECPRFRSGQFGSDGGMALFVHALTWLAGAPDAEFFLDRRASPAWAIFVRLCKSRRTRSSSVVGAATTSTGSETASGQPVAARIPSTLTLSSPATRVTSCDPVAGLSRPKSVITACGPAPGMARRVRSPCPFRKPALVQKSSFATKLRGDCFSTTKICLAWRAISGAPPAPGRRVSGWAEPPMTVVFRLPNRSICAAPRKPRSIRPACSQYEKISGNDTTAVAVSASSPSPIDNGNTLG